MFPFSSPWSRSTSTTSHGATVPSDDGGRAASRKRLPRVQWSQWLLTFDKQWMLVHCLATFACLLLLLIGAVVFVTAGLGSFQHSFPGWLGLALGMISASATGSVFARLVKIYEPNLQETLEQQSTRRFFTTVVGVLVYTTVAVLQAVYAYTSPCITSCDEGWSSCPVPCSQAPTPLFVLHMVALVAACTVACTVIFDIVKFCRSGSATPANATWDEADDVLEDEAEYEAPRRGAVRLE